MTIDRYWIHHSMSDSYFAAKDAVEAAKIANDWNNICISYGFHPLNKIELVDGSDDLEFHKAELNRREQEGDESYFTP